MIMVNVIIESGILDIIKDHPRLSDSEIMSLIVHGKITDEAAAYA